MSFQSLSFLAFLAVTALLALTAGRKSRTAGVWVLTGASVLFCLLGQQGVRSLLVLVVGCCVTGWASRFLGASCPRRRMALGLACVYHIGVLAVFKYTNFLSGGAVTIDWVPLGLSFFTFQQLWYLKEVYSGSYVPAPRDSLGLYGFFFPTLTSGPILRPSAFFPQLRGEGFLRPDGEDFSAGLYAICMGMAKKVLLADPLGVMVANGWSMGESLPLPGAWIVILGYTLQLYLDFSGYCDIASGIARLLGLRLPVNFDSPYRALSVGEFWKRWHITLTSFLRECLYFPLGGSRKGTGRMYGNILIVFLVSGLWHGTGWTFLVWGGLHGLAQIGERVWGQRREKLPRWLRWGMTFLFVNLAWVFFRAPSLSAAMTLLKAAVCGAWDLPLTRLAAGVMSSETSAAAHLLPMLGDYVPSLILTLLLGISLLVSLWPRNTIQRMERFSPRTGSAVVYGLLLVWVILSFSSKATFIYSNF